MPVKRVRIQEGVADPEPSDRALLQLSRKRMKEQEEEKEHEAEGSATKTDYESRHTLESDEEEEEKYHRLNVDNVDGQEDSTIEFDEDIKIEPFNMASDMAEGHFDSEGTFIFDRKKEEIKDAWLDQIDWSNVKRNAGDQWHQIKEGDEDDNLWSGPSGDVGGHVDKFQLYADMVTLMQPKETVTKALKRLGGSKQAIRARQYKWAKEGEPAESSGGGDRGDPEGLLQLTELVDRLVSEGEFEAYSYTYEKLSHELEKKAGDAGAEPESTGEGLDMFAEEVDDKVLEVSDAKRQKQHEEEETEIRWLVKRKNNDEAEIEGPYSTSQMCVWMDEDHFKGEVWVRRSDQPDAPFCSSRRIDFDLYM